MDVFRSYMAFTRIVPTIAMVIEMKLTFVRNVFGDEINALDCRSLWKDKHGYIYRCTQLKD